MKRIPFKHYLQFLHPEKGYTPFVSHNKKTPYYKFFCRAWQQDKFIRFKYIIFSTFLQAFHKVLSLIKSVLLEMLIQFDMTHFSIVIIVNHTDVFSDIISIEKQPTCYIIEIKESVQHTTIFSMINHCSFVIGIGRWVDGTHC